MKQFFLRDIGPGQNKILISFFGYPQIFLRHVYLYKKNCSNKYSMFWRKILVDMPLN